MSPTKVFVGDLSIKTRVAARARLMGVADLYDACSDWSTVQKCRPTIQRHVADKCHIYIYGVGDKCRRHLSVTFVGKCEQVVRQW